jgi:hypothetical protein
MIEFNQQTIYVQVYNFGIELRNCKLVPYDNQDSRRRSEIKTTLARHVFPNKPYVSLENPDIRRFAINDPRGFLKQYPQGAVFDEAQQIPEFFFIYNRY